MREAIRFLRRYSVCLLITALATLFTFLLWPLSQRFPFALFIAAVMVSTWQGGPRAGALATVLSTVILAFVYWLQATDAAETGQDYFLRLGMFVLVGVLAGYLSQQCKRAIAAVDHVHDILSSSGVALVFTDAQGRVTHMNPLAQSLTGWSLADVREERLERVLVLVGPDGRPSGQTLVADVLHQRIAHDFADEALLVSATGGRTPVEGTAAPVRDNDDRVVGVVITFRDATRRREAEKDQRQREGLYRAAAACSAHGLLILDPAGRCTYTNVAFQAACGCSLEESLGEGWTRYLSLADRTRILADWSAAAQAGQVHTCEFRFQPPDAAAHWVRLRTAPMLAESGTILGHVGVLEDLSERKQIEEALQRARDECTRQIEERITRQQQADESHQQERAAFEEMLQQQAAEQAQAREAAHAASAEFERQLQEERTADRRHTEEALQKARMEFDRRLEEAAAGRRQAEESLRQAREAFQKQCQELTAGQKTAEEALRGAFEQQTREEQLAAQRRADEAFQRGQDEFKRQLEEALARQERAEDALRAARAEWAERIKEPDVEQQQIAEALRSEKESLQQQIAELTASHKKALTALQAELAEYQERIAAQGRSEEALRRVQEEYQGKLTEADTGRRRAEEELAKTRAECTRQIEERTALQRQVEEALRGVREDFAVQRADWAAERGRMEDELRREKERLEHLQAKKAAKPAEAAEGTILTARVRVLEGDSATPVNGYQAVVLPEGEPLTQAQESDWLSYN